MHDDTVVKLVTIVALSVVLLAAVIVLGVVAVVTDRDLLRAELFTFSGLLVVAALGGFSWWSIRRRRHRWHLKVDRNGEDDEG